MSAEKNPNSPTFLEQIEEKLIELELAIENHNQLLGMSCAKIETKDSDQKNKEPDPTPELLSARLKQRLANIANSLLFQRLLINKINEVI